MLTSRSGVRASQGAIHLLARVPHTLPRHHVYVSVSQNTEAPHDTKRHARHCRCRLAFTKNTLTRNARHTNTVYPHGCSTDGIVAYKMGTLGVGPRVSRMLSECDTITPCARLEAVRLRMYGPRACSLASLLVCVRVRVLVARWCHRESPTEKAALSRSVAKAVRPCLVARARYV